MNKNILFLSLLLILSLSIVSATELNELYFEITPPEGYSIRDCSDSSIFMIENETGDVIDIFEVNGNTSATGYENVIEPHISNTIETNDYVAYKTYDVDLGGGSTILRVTVDERDFQLVWNHRSDFDESTFEHDVDILNQTAQSIKLK